MEDGGEHRASGRRAEDIDTARLVARFQAGDAGAFDALYLRYLDRVHTYLSVALNDPHEAEDIAQQVFLKAFEALPSYEPRDRPFRAWLFTVVRNHAITHLKKMGRIEPEDPAEIDRRRELAGESEPGLDALNWITDVDLMQFVERMKLPQRQVLMLRYMLELPTAEIARILGRTPADVRVLHHRALRFVEKRLKSLGRTFESMQRDGWQRLTKHDNVIRNRRHALDP